MEEFLVEKVSPSHLVYNGDIQYSKFEDFMQNGSKGGVYVSYNATDEQRKVLDTLVTTNIGANFMRKIFHFEGHSSNTTYPLKRLSCD